MQGLAEAILAIEYITRVQLQSREPPLIILRRKDGARLLRRRGCGFISALQDHRLNGRTQRPRELFVVPDGAKYVGRSTMVRNGFGVTSEGVQYVSPGPQC